MHRLLALVLYGRGIEVEGYGEITIGDDVIVRRDSINSEIARLNAARIHRIAKVDNEVRRLSVYYATASRVSGSDGKANQIPVCEGILLRLAVDGYSPVRPRSDMFGGYRGAVVVVAHIDVHDVRIRLRRQRTDHVREHIVR